nr:hypothetical protein [Candidatus Sigynarchaeota archaeon]
MAPAFAAQTAVLPRAYMLVLKDWLAFVNSTCALLYVHVEKVYSAYSV